MRRLLSRVRSRASSALLPAPPARALSGLRDFVAKSVLTSALDTFSTAPPRPAAAGDEGVPLREDIEYDALTWKSIVVRGPRCGARRARAHFTSRLARVARRLVDSRARARVDTPPATPTAAPSPSPPQDRPVVDSADNIHSDDLYPPSAPSLDDASLADESADALDFRAFPGVASVDPFALVGPDLRGINSSIKALLGVDHPVRDWARATQRRAVPARSRAPFDNPARRCCRRWPSISSTLTAARRCGRRSCC